MKPRCDFYSEMNPVELEAFIEENRRMSPEEKLAKVFESIRLAGERTECAVRAEYPQADDREVFLRVAARHLDRDLMIRAYGWDPKEH
jgi:hypothetical protein